MKVSSREVSPLINNLRNSIVLGGPKTPSQLVKQSSMGLMNSPSQTQQIFSNYSKTLTMQQQQEFTQILQNNQPSQIANVNNETEKKLKKLQELSSNDKEMIEMQRKTIYIQKLEIQNLQQKHDALRRNFEALTFNTKSERIELEKQEERINELEREKEKLQIQIKDLNNKLANSKQGIEDDHKKDFEIRELKEQNEIKKQEIFKLQKDVGQKQKKTVELEMRLDGVLKEKDREINELQNDLKNANDLIKEQLSQIKQKSGQILQLESQIIELKEKFKIKSESDMTMQEVIDRVKCELKQEYEPIIIQLKEEAKARDIFYQKEMDKQQKQYDNSNLDQSSKLSRLEQQIKEWENKYNDKLKECENYAKIMEEKRQQYNDMLSKKGEQEANKNNIIDDLEKMIAQKDTEILEFKLLLGTVKKQMLDKQREFDSDKSGLKDELMSLQKQYEIAIEKNSKIELEVQKVQQQNEMIQRESKGLLRQVEDAVQAKQQIIKKIMDKIEVHISCLSCSKIFSDCLMLVCGHSICNECLNHHSDPKSKDSIVFCEECKIETKNRHLVKSLAIKNINHNFLIIKQMIDQYLSQQ